VSKLGPHSNALHFAAAEGFTECAWELVMDNASLLTMANGNGWTPEVLARRRQHHGCARLLASFLNDGSAFCAVHSARAMLRRLAGSLEEAAQASRAASAEGATNEDCVMCDICFEDFNTTVQVVPCGHTMCQRCAAKFCEPSQLKPASPESAVPPPRPEVAPGGDAQDAGSVSRNTSMRAQAFQLPKCPFCRSDIKGFQDIKKDCAQQNHLSEFTCKSGYSAASSSSAEAHVSGCLETNMEKSLLQVHGAVPLVDSCVQ